VPDDSKLQVLVCPLDWGWGHASRVVPVIRALTQNGFRVKLGISGDSGKFLREEFPGLPAFEFPSPAIRYSKKKRQVWSIFKQVPKIILHTFKDHRHLKKLLKAEHIDLVISDHRYGLWNKQVYNIFITHQVFVKFPRGLKIAERIFNFFHRQAIKKYQECWVPDDKKNLNLAGKLSDSHPSLNNLHYIGTLSRFQHHSQQKEAKTEYDLLIILSGPEPQRSVLEDKLNEQLAGSNLNILFIRGTRRPQKSSAHPGIKYFDYLPSERIQECIQESRIVVCRAGYTSIMDLVQLEKKALLIPTPGQCEQEYLADYLKRSKYFYSVKQDEFNINRDIAKTANYHPPEYRSGLLSLKIEQLSKASENKIRGDNCYEAQSKPGINLGR
jgi:UDP-N-acetylglucosamine transferase subunit ALG13